MSNDLQTNLGYFMMINYDSFSLCHLEDIFFRNSRRRERADDELAMQPLVLYLSILSFLCMLFLLFSACFNSLYDVTMLPGTIAQFFAIRDHQFMIFSKVATLLLNQLC